MVVHFVLDKSTAASDLPPTALPFSHPHRIPRKIIKCLSVLALQVSFTPSAHMSHFHTLTFSRHREAAKLCPHICLLVLTLGQHQQM